MTRATTTARGAGHSPVGATGRSAPTDRPGTAAPVFACGEIRTAVLRNSEALTARTAARLLDLRPGEPVRLSERPNLKVVSQTLLTGVDCRLPTASGARTRGVGTLRARAVLTEGRVLQASVFARVGADTDDTGGARSGRDGRDGSGDTGWAGRRRPWGHYLVRPGTVEPLGRYVPADAVDGFLAPAPPPEGVLNPGAVAERLLDRVLRHSTLDQQVPFKSRRTRLRWTAVPSGADRTASIEQFTVAEDGLRTVALRSPRLDTQSLAALCEDLALHDWLLTTLIALMERSRSGANGGPAALVALRPAVDHLLHLWMPGARLATDLAPVWETLERAPGFSRQWQTIVQRIRDQVALHAVPLSRQSAAHT